MTVASTTVDQHSYRYYLDLTWHLIQRDFAIRYKGSVLGALWLIAIPMMQLITLVFVFNKVLPLNIEAYPAFVFSGLLPWTWFSNCLTTAGSLFAGNRDLVRRPNFPPILLITVNTFSNLLLYLTVLPLVFVMLYIFNRGFGWSLFFFPVLIFIQTVLIHGVSLIISAWNVFYKDVQQIVSILVSLFFWITPVFYRANAVDQNYQFLFDFNPMAGLIKGYHDIFFYSRPPDARELLFSLTISSLIGLIGYIVYRYKLYDVYDAL